MSESDVREIHRKREIMMIDAEPRVNGDALLKRPSGFWNSVSGSIPIEEFSIFSLAFAFGVLAFMAVMLIAFFSDDLTVAIQLAVSDVVSFLVAFFRGR